MKHLILFITTISFIACGNPSTQTKNTSNNDSSEATSEPETTPIVKSNWEYSEEKDELDGSTTKFASSTSINVLDFKFPYDGGSYGMLTIRNRNNKNEVLLAISKGQFMSSYTNSLRVKFDDDNPVKYTYSEPASASANLIFLNNEKKFIERLKTCKKIKIEATYYDEGNAILEFDVDGFKW